MLIQEGFPVEIFDRTPDVGGVWSVTRRYPGLRPQSSKRTYQFSDFPLPSDAPQELDGAQMQAYLAAYAARFGLGDYLRLNTEVVAADPVDSGWLLEIRDEDGARRTSCDHLVIANGVFSDPVVPEYRGLDLFEAAGGRVCHSSEFLDLESVRGKSVAVVGYGGAACEIAEAVSEVAAATTVVARKLHWKVPRTMTKALDFERLLLTRFGEAHFAREPRGRISRFLDRGSFRASDLDLAQELAIKRLRLRELDLVPEGHFEEFADATASVASEGFYEKVAENRIVVHRDTTIAELGGGRGAKSALRLANGEMVRADIVICATGFQQRVPFLTPYVQRRLTDDDGNFLLHRQILPLDVPNLTFVGYNASAVSTLNAEVSAHWTAALLAGRLAAPPTVLAREQIEERLRWMEERSPGHHAHGTAVTPFALRTIDEMLADLKYRLPLHARIAQWVRTVNPGSYRGFTERRKSSAAAEASTSQQFLADPAQPVGQAQEAPGAPQSAPSQQFGADPAQPQGQVPKVPGAAGAARPVSPEPVSSGPAAREAESVPPPSLPTPSAPSESTQQSAPPRSAPSQPAATPQQASEQTAPTQQAPPSAPAQPVGPQSVTPDEEHDPAQADQPAGGR
ncbi:hypothetical protein GCM10023318_31170 [Nocardia callitridis]|uniref:Monooxygenase n=1 Tax=Nocardia callitridis TaxID=648753 RepID=A0ABP9KER9_9NOCA